MTADITWDFDTIGASDGTAVTQTHFATTQALELFVTEAGTNTAGNATWETDENGVKYINVPKNSRLLLRVSSSTTVNNSTYHAIHVGGIYTSEASGETWPSSDIGKIIVDTSAGTDRVQIKHRARQVADISDSDLIWYDVALLSGSALSSVFTHPFPYAPVERSVSYGYGFYDNASGGIGVWLDGHLIHALNGDTTGVTLTDFYDFDMQTDTFQDVRIYGPIKVWHTANDFRDEPEFRPDYTLGDFKDGRRPITDEVFPRYDISLSGTPSFGAAVAYQSSGNSYNRSRAVISGSPSESMTFTLRDDHAFTPATKNGRLPFVLDCVYLPGSASQIFSLDVGEANPLRILWDGSVGTSSTRQIKVDPCTGSFGTAIDTYNESKRYWCAIFLDNEGGEILMYDMTTSGHTTDLLVGGGLGYSGIPTGSLTPSVQVTVGSSGSPEFAGINQIHQVDSILVSSWVSSSPVGVDSDSPGASMVVSSDLSSSAGDKFELPGFSQTAELDTSYTFAQSGRAITDLSACLGNDDFATFMNLYRGQRLIVGEYTANDAHDKATIMPVVETFVAAAAANNVELVWIFQPPVDDNPASDQDKIREIHALTLAVLRQYAGDTVIWVADLASLYSDAEAAALSTDNVHPTAAGYKELGALVGPNLLRLASPLSYQPRGRDRSRTR